MEDRIRHTYAIAYSVIESRGFVEPLLLCPIAYGLVRRGIVEDYWGDWRPSIAYGFVSEKLLRDLRALVEKGLLVEKCIDRGLYIDCGVLGLPRNPVKPPYIVIVPHNLLETVLYPPGLGVGKPFIHSRGD